ncbi:MAG: PEGA domain-containing protein [Treponema sp.]|nr:PEGA domain-containing protein [Treponema sp.]
MRKARFAFIFFFALIPFAPLLWANDRDKIEDVAGKGLEIQSNPSGARVFINGVEYGLTPIYIDNLQPGKYGIELHKDEYEIHTITVILREDSRLIITAEMESARGLAYVSIQKAPNSPEDLPFIPELFTVTHDNSFVSVPLSYDNKAVLNLASNRHHAIRARAFGWEDETITLFVNSQNPAEAAITMKPAVFNMENASVSRKRFNPMNPHSLGEVDYRFEVSTHGQGTITIFDLNGNAVYKKHLEPFDTWIQQTTWNGRDISGNLLPQGFYTAEIEAKDASGEIHALNFETEINYSISIFPLSLENMSGGLTFVLMPHTLPEGSYQFNAGVIFGSFGFPFKINMRISPFNKFEITTVFNINADKTQAGWGISGSAKYNFLDGGDFPLALSASISYAWASNAGEYMLSPGKGVGIHVPLSLEKENFSVIFCPSVFWRGPEGIVPDLLLGAGVLYRGSWITCGISARGEINFTENKFRLLAGIEGHLILPPSNFIITLHSGIISAADIGWYAGMGIGFIY